METKTGINASIIGDCQMYPVDHSSAFIEPADPLTWDDTYSIARYLREQHADVDLTAVSLNMIYQWVIEHPAFSDDADLWNDHILAAIYQEWFEEVSLK